MPVHFTLIGNQKHFCILPVMKFREGHCFERPFQECCGFPPSSSLLLLLKGKIIGIKNHLHSLSGKWKQKGKSPSSNTVHQHQQVPLQKRDFFEFVPNGALSLLLRHQDSWHRMGCSTCWCSRAPRSLSAWDLSGPPTSPAQAPLVGGRFLVAVSVKADSLC